MPEILDCLIVGGGPAGLTAALYLARFRRKVLVADTRASRARWIPRSRNLAGFPHGVHGQDLLDWLHEQAAEYGAPIEPVGVEALELGPEGCLRARMGETWRIARTVILATGVVEIVPPVGGLAEAMKRGLVRVCPICDGYEAQDRRLAVFGDGEHAAREALFLRTYATDITLVLTPGAALGEGCRRELEAFQITVLHAEPSALTVQTDHVSTVCLEGGEPARFDLVYSAFGVTPQAGLATALGAARDDQGRLTVSGHLETSVSGLYAAGDVVRGLNQIGVAEAEGAIAATAIHNRLPRNPMRR